METCLYIYLEAMTGSFHRDRFMLLAVIINLSLYYSVSRYLIGYSNFPLSENKTKKHNDPLYGLRII